MTTNKQFPREGKMIVTPEQSRVLQERLFNEMYMWHAWGNTVSYTECPYLYWHRDDRSIRKSGEGDGEYFLIHPYPEYQFSDLFPEHKEELFDIAGGIVDIITILKNTQNSELVKRVLEIIKK